MFDRPSPGEPVHHQSCMPGDVPTGMVNVVIPRQGGARLCPDQRLGGVLEDAGDVGEEPRALLAVDEPVVEGQRERGDLARRRSRRRCTHGCLRTAPKHRIADSPGLMIGVPASTPKTPTLVIVNVPPLISAGCVLPSRAVAVSALSALRQLEQRERLGVLDVGDDQAARRGRGDAEVDVALERRSPGPPRPSTS